MFAIAAIVGLPVILFFRVFDCDLQRFLLGQGGAACWAALFLGIALGLAIGVFAFGATGTHASGWLWFRIDLHLRALLSSAAREGLKTTSLLTLLFVTSQALSLALKGIPLIGAVVEHTLGGYALFTGSHLVGLLFRRNAGALDPIYRD